MALTAHDLLTTAIGLISQFVQGAFPDHDWITPVGLAFGVALLVYAGGWTFYRWLGRAAGRPADHETDVSEVLHHVLHKSKWAELEHRRLNFRQFVDHLDEFKRAGRDEGLRTTGIPAFGGKPEPIDSRHWEIASIDPSTAQTRGGVSTKSSINRLYNPLEYGAVKVRTEDMHRLWPRASILARVATASLILCKRIYYLWTAEARAFRRRQWNTIRDNVRV
jgi:hypothetical protein